MVFERVFEMSFESVDRTGQARVHVLSDGRLTAPAAALVGAPAEEIVALLDAPSITIEVLAFAVATGDEVYLIDAGMGSGPPLGGLPEAIVRAGVDPARISTVLLTHLHPDHANGVTAEMFGAARVAVSRAEAAFVRDSAQFAAASDYVRHDYRSAAGVLDALAGRLHVAEELALPFALEPLPGHSAGHQGYRLRGASGARDVLFAGDLLHVAGVQVARPDISVIGDLDPALAARTRRDVLARCAEDGTLLAGAHIGPHGLYQVDRQGPAFRLTPYG